MYPFLAPQLTLLFLILLNPNLILFLYSVCASVFNFCWQLSFGDLMQCRSSADNTIFWSFCDVIPISSKSDFEMHKSSIKIGSLRCSILLSMIQLQFVCQCYFNFLKPSSASCVPCLPFPIITRPFSCISNNFFLNRASL